MMKLPRRNFLRLAAGAADRLGNCRGQTYPTGPITMVVPYPAAGLFDAVARVLAERMRKVLGRPVVIDALLS